MKRKRKRKKSGIGGSLRTAKTKNEISTTEGVKIVSKREKMKRLKKTKKREPNEGRISERRNEKDCLGGCKITVSGDETYTVEKRL